MREGAAEYTYIIVGAGTAGCVLANRLSEDLDARVLLLEAGGNDWSPYIRIPAGFLKISPKRNWLYPGEPDGSLGGRTLPWDAGKVLGGSSSINATFWTRGHPNDYNRWSELGCEGWDYQSVLPYFRRGESFEGGENVWRGGSGPQRVSFPHYDDPLIHTFIDAARQAGYPYNPDFNGERQEGVAIGQFSQRRGFRDSTATSYLRQARRRKNLRLEKGAMATQLIMENGRAVGVEYRVGSRSLSARAESEVICSAGTFGSTKLLLLAGIGPADELRAVGVEPLVDLPGVGKNLQEHAFAPQSYSVNVRTLNQELNFFGVVKHGLDFALRGRGGATVSGALAVAYTEPAGQFERPDFEFIFRPFSAIITPDGFVVPKESAVSSAVWYCHPSGRGTVRVRSADPSEPLLIDFGLIQDERDVAKLIEGVRLLRAIYDQPAFAEVGARETNPGRSVQSDDDIAAYLRSAASRGYHPSGTCKMGIDESAVVDTELRVRGVDGLRVVDASVLPELMTGHTNAPTAMIAEKAADLIRRRRPAVTSTP